MKKFNLSILSLILVSLIIQKSNAQWSTNTGVNNALCTATGNQQNPQIVGDGSGGAIIAWEDHRNGSDYDIYAQRITADGVVQWTTNGIAICNATSDQQEPAIISDGKGGAIITWQDNRSGNNDIYAQRITGAGIIKWTANGVVICNAANAQINAALVSDGSSGAIITWQDYRNGSNYDIYAQLIDSSGTTQWTANGIAVCSASGDQLNPVITSSNNGGSIIAWQDIRGGSYSDDIYAQRVSPIGAPQWTTNGVAICTALGQQTSPQIVTDGSYGAIITWQDGRDATLRTDVYVQLIPSTGVTKWTSNGIALTESPLEYSNPKIAIDGSGGAYIAMQKMNTTSSYRYIASSHVDNSGNAITNEVCTAGSYPYPLNPFVINGGSNSAIIVWEDYRTETTDGNIFAQYENSSTNPQWTANGVAVCTNSGMQTNPVAVSEGSGVAIIAWVDSRNGSSNTDIYVSYISSSGSLLPVELTGFTATTAGNSTTLAWKTATEVNNYGFNIERRIVDNQDLSQPSPQSGGQGWGQIGFVAGNGTSSSAHSYSYTDASVSSGTYAYRLKQIDNSGTFKYSSETEVTIAVPTSYALGQNYPNPFNPTTTINRYPCRRVSTRCDLKSV